MTSDLILGKYYTIRELNSVLKCCSLSRLYILLYRAEFAKFRMGQTGVARRQLYRYCSELIALVNEICDKKRSKNA